MNNLLHPAQLLRLTTSSYPDSPADFDPADDVDVDFAVVELGDADLVDDTAAEVVPCE